MNRAASPTAERAAARPRGDRPAAAEAETLIALLAEAARAAPRRPALRERDRGIWREYSWQDYLDRALAFAAGFEELGCEAFDRVLIVGDNRLELYLGMVGATALRAIPSPAYPDVTPEEIGGQIERERIRFALAEDQEQVDKLLSLRARTGLPEWIVYQDARGLDAYAAPGLRHFEAVQRRGREILDADPDLARALIGRAQAADVAALLHSSGTTGAPKGVPLRHRQMIRGVRSAAETGYFQPGEEHMAYLPMAWVGDFTFSVVAAIALRFTVNIPESQATIAHDMREIAPTLYFSSPRAWSHLLTRIQVGMDESSPLKRRLYGHFMPFATALERRALEGRRPSAGQRLWRAVGEALVFRPIKDQLGLARVRRPYTAGEAIGDDVFLYFRALGLDLRQFYGQTENGALATAQEAGQIKLHTVGKPFPGIEVKIDETGEILVRGDNVFDGYFEDDAASAEALADGWLRTGDAGKLEDDGQLVVLGRVSEVVHTAGGEQFIPTYIENRIKFSQYIRDVAIFGADRPHLAAIVCIDFDACGHWAQERGIAHSSYAELSQAPEVLDLVASVLGGVNGVLPAALRIRRFVDLHKAFDPDDGEVTRTRKLRRKVIEKHYAPILDALYDGSDRVRYQARITYETGETGVIERDLRVRDTKGAP